MAQTVKQYVIICAASTAQALPENAIQLVSASLSSTASYGVFSALTPVAVAPSAGQIEFAGTAAAPSNALTLNAAATAGQALVVNYVPASGNAQGF